MNFDFKNLKNKINIKKPEGKETFKAERKKRNYDEFFKKVPDKKKITMIIVGILVALLLVIVAFFAVKMFMNKPEPVPEPEPELTQEEIYYNELSSALSNGLEIGVTTKDQLIASGLVDTTKSGDNYLIKKDYTTINNIDYFTTYLLDNDKLVGILHEAMLDSSTKYSLANKFQTIVSDINRAYSNVEISKKWYVEPIRYDVDVWNDLIVNNDLELSAELAKDSEFIKIIASGVSYFDYMYENEYDQSFGNLSIIYSDGANQSRFSKMEDVKF